MKIKNILTALLITIVLNSCAPIIQEVAPTEMTIPISPQASFSIRTEIPRTNLTGTVEPEFTSTFAVAPIVTITPHVIELKAGRHYVIASPMIEEPLSSWKDIPVIPTAIKALEGEHGYFFLAESTLEDAQNYYVVEMAQHGWRLTLLMNQYAGNSLEVIEMNFKKGTELNSTSVSIFPQSSNLLYIILAWHY